MKEYVLKFQNELHNKNDEEKKIKNSSREMSWGSF